MTEQYAGRTYDVMALQGVKATGSARLSQEFAEAGESGTISVGAQKLAQRFIIEFLTELGSMPYAPEKGSVFMTMFRTRKFRTELDIRAAFAIAASDILQKLSREETENDPADERLESIDLLAVAFLGTTLGLTVQLKTKDPNRPVILPIAIPIER